MQIRNKDQMYAMLREGKLGNTLRTWDSEESYLASGFRGRTSLRCRKPGIAFRHGMTHEEALREGRLCFEGCQPEDFIYCEAAPDWECTFQGEVQWGLYGLDLFWSTAKANHRVAMQSAKQVHGVTAITLLRHHLDPQDLDDLLCLLDLYDGCVIEFSVFRVSLGKLNRRMIVWEVRHY